MLTSTTTDVLATDAQLAYVNERLRSAVPANPRVPSMTVGDVKERSFNNRPLAYSAGPE